MNRKYKKPTEVLVRATKVANEIAAEAPKIKAEVDGQVKDNLNVVQSMLKETANDIKKMSRKKDKALIAELNANLASADSAAAQAATDFNAGEVMKAASSLEQVQKLIKKITTALKPPADEPQM